MFSESVWSGPVAHQAACAVTWVAAREARRQAMARRQRQQLRTPTILKSACGATNSVPTRCCRRAATAASMFAVGGATVTTCSPSARRPCAAARASRTFGLGIRVRPSPPALPIGAVAGGTRLHKSSQPLGDQLVGQEGHAGDICARPVETRDEADLNRVAAGWKTMGIVAVAALATIEGGVVFATITVTDAAPNRPPASAAGRWDRGVAILDRTFGPRRAGFTMPLREATSKCARSASASYRAACRSPASPPAAAPAPRAATPPPRRRAA